MGSSDLLRKVLSKAQVSIADGQLMVEPYGSTKVPLEWLQDNKDELIHQILMACNSRGYVYDSYTTDRYKGGRLPGITIRFRELTSLESAYVVFNVDLDRTRTTQTGAAGSPLPSRHFTPKPGSKFVKFWRSLGLKLPQNRLSTFHTCMGKIGEFILTAELDRHRERLDKDSLRLLSVTHDELLTVLSHKESTTNQQGADNCPTRLTDKQFDEAPIAIKLDGKLTACPDHYDISKQGNEVTREELSVSIRPEDQSVDEWLKGYDRPTSVH